MRAGRGRALRPLCGRQDLRPMRIGRLVKGKGQIHRPGVRSVPACGTNVQQLVKPFAGQFTA
eukprot:10174234-Alexandrium_andersonii.AAC.1